MGEMMRTGEGMLDEMAKIKNGCSVVQICDGGGWNNESSRASVCPA